ncbi:MULTISPECIES: hypothetical protein [unclassified Viridibacillus]|nr:MULTISPECIES: hypothetical protein [unclassified Viridibacillus]OMC84678.1 hypothetical protein BK130_03405 [Viridibacillus sp. FSL H8-0123]OMC86095.1 hypothetical protein BK128_13820 [Viridibacillus sp. FSL H7-0596]
MGDTLFTAFSLSGNNGLRSHLKMREKSNRFTLIQSTEISNNVMQYLYDRNGIQIYSYAFLLEDENGIDSYLFIENNEIFEQFVSHLKEKNAEELSVDLYLDVHNHEQTEQKLNQLFQKENTEDESYFCHLFGQQMWHGNAYMVANRAALLGIKEAIEVALENEESRVTMFPSDGEAYDLFIKCTNEGFDWEQIKLPYHNPEVIENNKDQTKKPAKFFERFKRILAFAD